MMMMKCLMPFVNVFRCICVVVGL